MQGARVRERGVQGRQEGGRRAQKGVQFFRRSRCNAPLTNFDEARVPNPHAVLLIQLRASLGPWEN